MIAACPELILLKGAPGVGKSTVAKLVARQYPSGVRIEVDILREMVTNVNWTDQAEHRSLLTLAAQLCVGFLRSGFAPVILIDTFSGDKIDGFLSSFRAEYPNGRVSVAVLHAVEDVLRQRIINREARAFRDLAVALQINREAICDVRPFEVLIDTSNLSPIEVAHAVLGAF